MNGGFVLITGASGGIGLELAKVFAGHGFNLILVARSKDKLEKVSRDFMDKCKVKVCYFVRDLSRMGDIRSLYDEIKENNMPVDILVNNAGFGYWGYIKNQEEENLTDMINLNITGLTLLTKLFLRDMEERGFGKVLNVASIASFFPLPYGAVYGGTKAYVKSFTQALQAEYKDKNIQVSLLCPPDVKTGFQAAAGFGHYEPEGIFSSTVEKVAKTAFDEFMKNKSIIKPWSPAAKLIVFSQRFLPEKVVVAIVERIMKSRLK